jgi:hypothetical protein
MVTLPSLLVSGNFGACIYQCSLSNCTHYFLACVKLVEHTLSCSFANMGHADIMWLLSRQIVDIVCICYLFLVVTFLLHYVLLVMSDLNLISSCWSQISPRQPQECVFFTNKLAVCTALLLLLLLLLLFRVAKCLRS